MIAVTATTTATTTTTTQILGITDLAALFD